MPEEREKVAEICSGAGGMAGGFCQHFDIETAIDKSEPAVRTYGSNHIYTRTRRLDICNITGSLHDFDGITGVIGGPPCQGSSIINTKRRVDDPRNALMGEFMRLVEEIQPRFFVMENVPGVPKEMKNAVIRAGEFSGYNVTSVYLNAALYGAAQTRKRWIVVGIKGRKWTMPTQRKPRTLREALAPIQENWGMMQSRPDVLETLKRAVPGQWTAMSGKFRNMTKLEWDRPSPAVVNLKKVYMVHPDELRNISLAEAAALQGFPPGYIWKGNESEIAQMIANAMPSPLAEAIAGSVA